MGHAHRCPAVEDLLAVGVGRRRQDRDARTRPPGRRQQIGIEGGHRGKEFTGADERHGSGHGRESSGAPRGCADVVLPHSDGDATPALDPRRDGHRVGDRVPRRDRRERRAAEHRAGPAGEPGRRPRGPDLHRQRVSRGTRRPAHPVRRPVRPLRSQAHLHDRPGRIRDGLRPVRPRPDDGVAHRSSGSSRARPGPSWCRARSPSSRRASRATNVRGRSGSGRRPRPA